MSHVRNLRGLLSLLPLGLAGCASPMVPKPPSLQLPQLATNLRSERAGDQVTVTWKTSADTTDKLKARLPIRAVVCREGITGPDLAKGPELKATGKDLAPCATVATKDVMPGDSEASFTLPPDLMTGKPQAIVLRVELKNRLDRSAGRSEATLIASGPAPGPVEGLQIESTRPGALVRWQARPDAATVQVQRLLLSSSAKPKTPKPAASPESAARPNPPAPPTPVVLQAGTSTDPGGMVDAGVERGSTYRYTAQRLQEVELSGEKLLIRGPLSQPVAFAMRDTFPPLAPAGLAAVPGPGSIDLSWEANNEADLTGYLVYRRSGDGPETKLTAEPVPSPSFRDTTAAPGAAYRYRVTAVDSSGNESKPSVEAIVTPQ